MVKYTKEELIRIIRDYSEVIERTPKMKEVACDRNLPPINQFLKMFGSWNGALENAELKINRVGRYNDNEILRKLVEIKIKKNRNPKLDDLKYFNNAPSSEVYFRKFGSWNNALRLAGLKINVRKDYKKEELLKLLMDKAKELGRSPKIKDLGSKNNMPDKDPYERCFGGFNKALEVADLEVMYVFRKWAKEDVINWLVYKYQELGRTPGIRDFDNDVRTPSKGTVRKLFGNWTNALREANVPVRRFFSEKELINILHKLYLELNRTPTREELKERTDCPSYIPFVIKFGSYTAACLRAGLVPNDGRNNKIWKGWQKHCEEMARVIYGNIEVQFKDVEIGIPDIYIPNKNLFIEVKTCGYKDFKEQIRRYCSKGRRLEFWCIFKGIETTNEKVKYVYVEGLAKTMKALGRQDLAAKCHQFIRNVFDEEQTILN